MAAYMTNENDYSWDFESHIRYRAACEARNVLVYLRAPLRPSRLNLLAHDILLAADFQMEPNDKQRKFRVTHPIPELHGFGIDLPYALDFSADRTTVPCSVDSLRQTMTGLVLQLVPDYFPDSRYALVNQLDHAIETSLWKYIQDRLDADIGFVTFPTKTSFEQACDAFPLSLYRKALETNNQSLKGLSASKILSERNRWSSFNIPDWRLPKRSDANAAFDAFYTANLLWRLPAALKFDCNSIDELAVQCVARSITDVASPFETLSQSEAHVMANYPQLIKGLRPDLDLPNFGRF